MAIEIVYFADEHEFGLPLPEPDFELAGRLRERHPAEADVLFATEEEGAKVSVRREDVLSAIDMLLAAMKSEDDLVRVVYSLDYEIMPGVPVEGSPGATGLRIRGEPYRIETENGRCILQKLDWQGRIISEEDISHLSKLQTDNMGAIKIRHGKEKVSLGKNLKRLRSFLQKHRAPILGKMLDL